MEAVVSTIGAALTPEPAAAKGFTLERTYYTLDGKEVDLKSAKGGSSTLAQTDRLVVVLKVKASETGGRILLVDRLPAGLEIENPRIVDSGDLKSFSWLKTTLKPQHTASSVTTASWPPSTSSANRAVAIPTATTTMPRSRPRKPPSPTSCAR